jgi:hypothetical protein
MVLAGMSQRNTWHMCLRVMRSRATYAKSLFDQDNQNQNLANKPPPQKIVLTHIKDMNCFPNSSSEKWRVTVLT